MSDSEELRCPAKLHFVLIDGHILERKCNSKFCGHEPGIVVLHRWDINTGELIETLKYRSTTQRGK